MKKSKFTARDVEVLSRISAALQVIDHDVTELNAVLLKVGEMVRPETSPTEGFTLVRMVRSGSQYYSKGDIGSVVTEALEEDSTTFWVDFNNQGNSYVHGDGRWLVARPHFEVIEAEVKPAKSLPLVGDKILITNDVYPYFSKGDIALVIEVNEEQHHVSANFKCLDNPKVYLGGCWCVHFDNLEVIPHVDEDSK